MKKIIKFIAVVTALCIILTVNCFAVETEIPYDTYTYWYTGSESKVADVTPIYNVEQIISAEELGLPLFESLDDVFSDDKGLTYILDGAKSEIIILDSDYNLIRTISEIKRNDETLNFTGAKSVYVKNGIIYICDTENKRVLLIDENGNYIDELQKPDSPLIPEDFAYSPIKVSTDNYGYTYILCDGSYYGAILLSDKQEFVGFFGANTVKNGILGSIASAFERMFVNSAKKGATATALPYAFSDLYIDSKNFVYTATGYTNATQTGQIKKLNPGGGSNIIESDDFSFVDSKINTSINLGKNFNQNIVSLEIDEYGYIYALDSGHGKVLIYNQDCYLISAFGGGMHSGNQKGTFQLANALTVNGTKLLVSDSSKKTVTVFEQTDFGKQLFKAGYLTENGDYKDALPIWKEIIAKDRNCSFAYSGIALALLENEDYKGAMSYAKQGYDRETYALAFKEVRNDWLENNFGIIIAVSILLITAVIVLMISKAKGKIKSIQNEQVSILLSTPFHPGKAFYKIQEKKLGSYAICGVIVIVYYIVSVLNYIMGGFAFTNYDPESFNSLIFFIRSTGIILLWVIVNWAVSAIFGGRGKIKEIAVVTCYSLLPMILGEVISIILTNILVPDEAAFISIIYTGLKLYSLILIMVGTVVIHDYDLKHFIGTTLLTVIGIAIVIFIMIMVILLVQQLWSFIATVFSELTL